MNLSVVIPWILTLMTAAVGVWQFTQQQAQGNKQPFLQKQLEVSFEASDAAARLASDPDPVEWEKSRQTFWRLYWGTLSVVEDPDVEGAMVTLGQLVPDKPVDNPVLPMKSLEIPSYKLAHAVRQLILRSWKIDLPPLQGARKE